MQLVSAFLKYKQELKARVFNLLRETGSKLIYAVYTFNDITLVVKILL